MRSALLIATILLSATSARAEIAWRANLKSAHEEATASGKLILVHFYSDNCVWCDRLEQGTFQDPAVATAIEAQFVPVKINGTRESQFASAFSVSRYPTDVIVASDGSVLVHQLSPQDTSRYLAMLSAPEVSGRIARDANPNPASSSVAAMPTAAPQKAATQALVPQAAVPQITIPQATVPQVTVPPATVPQVSVPPATVPQVTSFGPAPGREPAFDASSVAVAGGTLGSPVAIQPSPQVAGPGPEMAGFALPPGIAAGNFDMHAFGGTPAIAAGHRGAGLAAPTNSIPTNSIPTNSIPTNSIPTNSIPANSTPANSTPAITEPAQPLPPEAMDGYCPVTMITETRWAQGKPEYGVIHLGQLYLFASADAKRKFQASPEQYTPVLNGIDVVKFFEERKIVPGCREWGFTDPVYGRMFFFADEASMNHFYDHHHRYVEPAIELTRRAAADANRRQ